MIAIRPYAEEDWPSICAVHDAARPDELKGSCDPRAFVPLEEDPEVEELRRCTVLVADDGGDVVGFTAVDGAYLGWLYVHPDYYRQGIGRKLLRAALEEVSRQAWTIVLAGNGPAIGLYTDEGFREVTRFASENAGYPCMCVRMVRPGGALPVDRKTEGVKTVVQIHQAQSEEDKSHVRELFWEYLQWANQRVKEEFGVSFDIEAMLEDDMAQLEIFFPPEGRVLLATEESRAAGIACLKRIREDVGEIKRMYVRPEFRGKGIGRSLLKAIVSEAREMGYPTVRLDSARFMEAAHSLYRSSGFREIEPYPESEIPPVFQANWIFMERELSD